jgi:hypothetical protein
LTKAFSKKLSHLKAAVDLYALRYNVCRVHQTLRVAPAMEAGLTDHIWSIEELLTASIPNHHPKKSCSGSFQTTSAFTSRPTL